VDISEKKDLLFSEKWILPYCGKTEEFFQSNNNTT
jgi:hypothetical protein